MANERIVTAIGGSYLVFHLGRTSDVARPTTHYLHSVRRGGGYLLPGEADRYFAVLPKLAEALALAVEAGQNRYDAIVCPPSTRHDLILPYKAAILSRLPSAVDLSAAFERRPGTSAALAAGYSDVEAGLSIANTPGGLNGVTSILFIDDVFARGFTATAIERLLKSRGCKHLRFDVACALVADGVPDP